MVLKTEVIVEQFENGISIQWKDLEGQFSETKKIAYEDDKVKVLGGEIMEDIDHFLDSAMTDKLRMVIAYEEI
jgi:hypothetical protein